METNTLKQFYQEQLVRAGVERPKAEQAAQSLTKDELLLISEVCWSEWVETFYEIEREILTLAESSPSHCGRC